MHCMLVEMQCCLSSHSDEHGHRVELGKHSLESGEEGSLSRSAAVIVAHEDYNILLSRSQQQQLHANTLHII